METSRPQPRGHRLPPPSPGHPLRSLPAHAVPAHPSKVQIPRKSTLTFVGEAKARGVLLPCLAAARLLQEEEEEEKRGEGQPAAGGSLHSGSGEGGSSPSQHHGPAPRCHLRRQLQAEKGEGCTAAGLRAGRDPRPAGPWLGRVLEGGRVTAR